MLTYLHLLHAGQNQFFDAKTTFYVLFSHKRYEMMPKITKKRIIKGVYQHLGVTPHILGVNKLCCKKSFSLKFNSIVFGQIETMLTKVYEIVLCHMESEKHDFKIAKVKRILANLDFLTLDKPFYMRLCKHNTRPITPPHTLTFGDSG